MRKALGNGSVSPANPDKLSAYEELRREDLRIKRLKGDALERDASVAAGELIPAADVQARLSGFLPSLPRLQAHFACAAAHLMATGAWSRH